MITSKITQGIKNGDAEAVEYLYTNYFKKFASIAYRYAKNWEDAEDIASDAFMRMIKYIKYLKDDDQLFPWCTIIVKNTAINFLRKKKPMYGHDEQIQPLSTYTGNNIVAKLDLEITKKAIQKLPPGYRKVITMAGIEEKTGHEIAKELGIVEVTSRTQLWKARKLLRNLLKEEVAF